MNSLNESRFNESVVEDAALTWFEELGYAIGHGPHMAPGEPASERNSFSDVVLVARLRQAIWRLNPEVPEEAREEAVRKALRIGTPSLTQTNRTFHAMLRDGMPVEYKREDASIAGDFVQLIDFEDVTANDWLAVNQFTVVEGQNNRRPDIVVFVNGLPLAVVELTRISRMKTPPSGLPSSNSKPTNNRSGACSTTTRFSSCRTAGTHASDR